VPVPIGEPLGRLQRFLCLDRQLVRSHSVSYPCA
jgi:hypothetical protein